MKLHHLKHEGCPTCNSRVVMQSQRGQHTNGQWFESIEFECGAKIYWTPNFSNEGIERMCPRDEQVKEREEKRKQARKLLWDFINNLDVDNNFKEIARFNLNLR